jgi:hypothetical protein
LLNGGLDVFQLQFLIPLLIILFPVSGLAYEPPRTPVDVALANGKRAFVGKLISFRYIEKSKGIETVEGQFEVLFPIYGNLPEKNERIKIKYHTLYEVDPCLDFEEIPAGTIVLFVFKSVPVLSKKVLELNYCWTQDMDLAYKISSPIKSYEDDSATLQLNLISGWWSGDISLKKLRGFVRRNVDSR